MQTSECAPNALRLTACLADTARCRAKTNPLDFSRLNIISQSLIMLIEKFSEKNASDFAEKRLNLSECVLFGFSLKFNG